MIRRRPTYTHSPSSFKYFPTGPLFPCCIITHPNKVTCTHGRESPFYASMFHYKSLDPRFNPNPRSETQTNSGAGKNFQTMEVRALESGSDDEKNIEKSTKGWKEDGECEAETEVEVEIKVQVQHPQHPHPKLLSGFWPCHYTTCEHDVGENGSNEHDEERVGIGCDCAGCDKQGWFWCGGCGGLFKNRESDNNEEVDRRKEKKELYEWIVELRKRGEERREMWRNWKGNGRVGE